MLICRKWGSTDVRWKVSNWLWSECQLAEELGQIYESGIDASRIYENDLWRNEPEKRKRLIRLICKVKGEKYDESKEKHENIKIKVEDIKLVIKAVLDIELKVKE
jgi:hypothetical protein